jgi:hypothetical protein
MGGGGPGLTRLTSLHGRGIGQAPVPAAGAQASLRRLNLAVLLGVLAVLGVAAQPGSEVVRSAAPSSVNLVRREAKEPLTDSSSLLEKPASLRHAAAHSFSASRARAQHGSVQGRRSGSILDVGLTGRNGLGGAHTEDSGPAADTAPDDDTADDTATTNGDTSDDHAVDNYGIGTSVSRLMNEKQSCKGACADGWDDDTLGSLEDGRKVHGPFFGNSTSVSSIQKTMTISGNSHAMVRVSMVFWSMGRWNGNEKGYLKINGMETWAKSREMPMDCSEWNACGQKIVMPEPAAHGPLCCQLVSKSINNNGNAVIVEIGSNFGQDRDNVSFAVSDVLFDVISAV